MNPYKNIQFEKRTSEIKNIDGSSSNLLEVTVPTSWSEVASDIIAQKYFRKNGVPQKDENGETLLDENNNPVLGPRDRCPPSVHRLALCWRQWGENHEYFDSAEDAQTFQDELEFMLAHQMAAPNSPQWFNTGLHSAYNITGKPQGHYFVNPLTESLKNQKVLMSVLNHTHVSFKASMMTL